MAFTPGTIDKLAVSIDGLEWWDYQTTDTIATVEGAGYFNAFASSLNLNDKLLVTASDNIVWYYISAIVDPTSIQGVVTSKSAASVTITAGTPRAGTVTNAMLANMATGTMKARESAGSGAPEDVSYPIPPPQGRLTLTTATPVMIATTSAQTTVYYTPYIGTQVPIYNGTNFVPTNFTELSQATTDSTKSPAAVTTNSNYDVFVWNDSGTIRATRGPLWSSSTTRGTGAGTTELTRVSGFYLNANSITNGPAAQRGTYVGTIRSNGSSQIDWILGGAASGGTAGVLNVWNCYNRVPASARAIDNGVSYAYTNTSYRQPRASAGNQISWIAGLQEDVFFAWYGGTFKSTATNTALLSMGFNSTTVKATGVIDAYSGAAAILVSPTITLNDISVLGLNFVTGLEFGAGGGSNFDMNTDNTTCFTMAM